MPIDLIDVIQPKNNGDFPIANDEHFYGGFRTTADLTVRDAIPSQRRKEGMQVKVVSNDTLYELKGGITNGDWSTVDQPTFPGSSIDDSIARWDGTGGDSLQDSKAIIDDTGLLSISGLNVNGNVLIAGADDVIQLTIKENSVQSNTSPLIQFKGSDDLPICSIHTDSQYNIFVGLYAGRVNAVNGAEGTNNSFIGNSAGYSNTSGKQNTYIGAQAGYYNTVGTENTCFGYGAGFGINGQSTYSDNVFIGVLAGQACTTGSDNMAMGWGALYWNETGTRNVCLGKQAGAGTSGQSNSDNVWIGYQSGFSITTAGRNVAIGRDTLRNTRTGFGNVCIGYEAGQGVSGQSADNNVFIGYLSGTSVTTGSTNTAVGMYSLEEITTGSLNMAFGRDAGRNITEGSYNICLGYRAGDNLTIGGNNILIGNVDATSASANYELNIGDLITGELTGSKQITIDGDVDIYGDLTVSGLDVNDDRIRIRGNHSPASNGSGIQGEIAWDDDYVYVCTATNTWKRATLVGGY